VWSILCTVLFFPGGSFTGVVAIVYGFQVNRRLAEGDWDAAVRASRLARTWCLASLAIGIVLVVIAFATGAIHLPKQS